MLIRPADADDIKNIALVYVFNHKTTYKGLVSDDYLDNLTAEKAAEKWKAYLSDEKRRMWVALEENEFLGFVASMPDSTSEKMWYLDSLHICPEARGKGIGTALIKTVGEFAFRNGYDQMSVCIVEGNNKAKQLYMKLGARHFLSFKDKFDNSTVNSEKLLWDNLKFFE